MLETTFAALLMIGLGTLLRRAGIVRRADGRILVQLTLYVFMPALVLKIFVGADLNWDLILVPVVAFLVTAALAPIALLAARALHLSRATTGGVIICIAIANTGFFGLPLIAASGGEYSLPVALMYDALGTGILIWTFSPVVASFFGEGHIDDRISIRSSLRGLLLPPMWALVTGLILTLVGVQELPSLIDTPVNFLAAALLPMVMLYVGIELDISGIARHWRAITAVSVGRLVVGPVVAFAIGGLLGFRGEALNTITVLGGMPSGMMVLVLGSHYRLPTDLLAGCVAVTTVLSLATLPIISLVVH